MAEPAILVRNVSKRRGRALALDNVSLDIEKGQFFALLGANGAGKTTLINCLTTVSVPDSGSIQITGIDSQSDPKALRRKIGVVFQEQSLDSYMTVRENLEFHARVYKVPLRRRRTRIAEMLELAGLGDRSSSPVRNLSGGMRRRLEIVRAFLHKPEILFLDEPTIGLDPQSRRSIWRYIHALRSVHDNTLVVTTHYIEEVEQSDRVCIIDNGRVIAQDTPEQLKTDYGSAAIRMTLEPLVIERGSDAQILANYPGAILDGLDIVLPCREIGQKEKALADEAMHLWKGSLRRVALEGPTLESAFLNAIANQRS